MPAALSIGFSITSNVIKSQTESLTTIKQRDGAVIVSRAGSPINTRA